MSGGWLEIALGGFFAFAEAILGVGILLPGEVAVTGVAASVDASHRLALVVAVALGATAGDHLNYWLGRLLGARLESSRLIARIGRRHWDRAVGLVHRFGAWAVIGSRLIPVVRTLVAATAGVAVMPYRRFALASIVGSLLWATAWVLAGTAVRGTLTNPRWLAPAGAATFAYLLLRGCRSRRATSSV